MSDEVAQGREPGGAPGPFAPGGRHRRTAIMAAVVVAFLVVIALVGVFRDPATPKPRTTPTPTPSPTAATGSDLGAEPPLQLTSTRCATLRGSELTVGFGVVNRGTRPLTVGRLVPAFPIGGLAVDDAGTPDLAACSSPATGIPAKLQPGDATVLALVLEATDPQCVAPLVVDVEVGYTVDEGRTYGENLHAFPDLGGLGLPSVCGSPSG